MRTAPLILGDLTEECPKGVQVRSPILAKVILAQAHFKSSSVFVMKGMDPNGSAFRMGPNFARSAP